MKHFRWLIACLLLLCVGVQGVRVQTGNGLPVVSLVQPEAQAQSTFVSQNFDGVTAPARPTGWVYTDTNGADVAGIVTTTSNPASGANALLFGPAAVVNTAFFNTVDTGSGNVTFSAKVRLNSAGQEAFIIARGTSTAWTTLSGYTIDIQDSGASAGVALTRKANLGANTNISTRIASTQIATATYYIGTITCSGSTITGRLQRVSDSMYLNSSGAWQAGATNFASVTDATYSAAGYCGVGDYGTANGVQIDDCLGTVPTTTATFAVDSTHWYAAPYATFSDGSGAINATSWLHADCTYLWWNAPGGYCRTALTLPSGTAGTVSLSLDLTNYTGSSYWPYFKVSVDNGIYKFIGGTSSNVVTLATGLPAGTHQFEFQLMYNANDIDRWVTPSAAVKVLGLIADVGSGLSPPTYTPASTYALVLGDSITAGANGAYEQFQANSAYIRSDGSNSWGALLARALGTEYGLCAYEGTGYVAPNSTTNVPVVGSSWSNYYSGHSRLVGGLLSPAPNFIIVNEGTNDNNVTSSLTTNLTALLPALRTAAPGAEILVVVPFNGNNRATITSIVNTRKTSDAHVWLIDIGTQQGFGYPLQSPPTGVALDTPNQFCPDGIHPSGFTHALMASKVFANYQAQKSAVAGTITVKPVHK